MRILYLENKPKDAELTLRAFQSKNPTVEVIVSGSVESALRVVKNNPLQYFDIFISEFHLPDGDAIQFMDAIHLLGEDHPVVIVTSLDDPKAKKQALQRGIEGYFIKEPGYLQRLPEKIEKIHASFQENRRRLPDIHVLYAERSPTNAELTQLHFATHAAHIILQVVSSFRELEKIGKPKAGNPEYDVILLDADLQKPGNLDLLKKIKTEWKIEQPVILLLAAGNDQLTMQAFQQGAENCVVRNVGYFQVLPAMIEAANSKARLLKEQKNSLAREQLFRLLAENARDVVFRLRLPPHFGFDYISTAVKGISGYTPEELYQKPSLLLEAIDPRDLYRVQEIFSKPVIYNQPILIRWRKRDGQILSAEIKGNYVRDTEGKAIAIEGVARDVSERIKFETTLQAEYSRREELETIINKSPMIVVRWKPKVHQPVDYISDNISTLGYHAKDFLDGKITYTDIVHPEDVAPLEREIKRHARQNDLQYRMRYRLVTKLGETRWVDDLTWVVKNKAGKMIYHQGVVTDITEKVLAEKELHETEVQYHQLVEQIPAVTYVASADKKGANLYISPQIEILTGYTPKEWLASPGFWLMRVHPDDREQVRTKNERMIQAGTSLQIEYRSIRKDSRIIWIEDRCRLLRGEGGKPDRWQGVLVDITERKNAEENSRRNLELFELALEGADLGFWTWDIPAGQFSINPRCFEMLGYREGEIDPTVKNWDALTHPDDLPRVYKIIDAHFAGSILSFDMDVRMRTKSGEFRWVRNMGKVIERDSTGSPLRAAGTLKDITERKREQEEEKYRIQRNEEERQAIIQLALNPAASSGDFDTTIRYTTETVARVLGIERVSVWMFTKDEESILCEDLFEKSRYKHSKGLELKSRDYPTYFESMRVGRSVAVDDAQHDPRTSEFTKNYLQPLGITSLLDSAIRVRSKMVGVVCFEHVGGNRHWNEDEVNFSGEIADQIAQVILNKEQHQAEEALRESESSFRSIFEQASDAILIWNENKLIDCNHQAEILYRWEKGEMLGKNPSFLSPETQPGGRDSDKLWLQKYDQALSGIPQLFEWVQCRRDGTLLDIEITLSRIELGARTIVQGMVRDITERKKALEEIRVSEEKYRGLFENTVIGISQNDLDGKIITANNAFAQIFGYASVAEMVKADVRFDRLYTNVFANPMERKKLRQLFLEKGKVGPLEITTVKKDGSKLTVLATARGIRNDLNNLVCIEAEIIDITQRKLAELSLQSAEQRYRGLFEHSPISLWEEDFSEVKKYIEKLKKKRIKDFGYYFYRHPEIIQDCMSRLKILDVNQATVKLYKAKSKEDLKENIGKIICAESFRGEVEEILKIAQGNCDFAFETVTQTLDGEKLNTYIHWKVISGFENTLSRVMISILDISAKKKAEETLRQSEQNYRELFEHMPSAVAVFQAVGEGDDFIFLDFNKKAEEIEGISRSEVFGKKMTKAFPGSVRLGILDVFRRVWKTGKEEYLQEGLYRDEKGKESWRENWVYRLPGGKVVAIYADITERKQTEEAIRISAARYRGLVESQIAVISRVNMKGEITFINEEFIRVFGKKREDWIGRTTDELIAKEDRERVSGVIEKAKSPPYITHSENRNITGKGIRWYRWENSAVLDLQGKVVELQFMGRDITEEREALNTLERREKLLEVVNFTATKLMETANWKQNTPAILERVGLNAEVDTILLMQTNAGRQPMELPQMLENMIVWLAPGIEQNQLVLQILSRIRPEAIFNQWRKKLSTGEAIVAESQSSRLKQTIMGALGIKKMAIIPILVEGGLWGILGFEQIQRDREWDDIDLDAFQTLGDSFASAIQRNNAYSALVDRETRLKAILDATTDAISVHSKTNRVYVNRAWYRLFGITKNEDLKRIASSDLIAPQDRPRYLEIRKAINANKPVHGLFEFKGIKRDSREFDLELNLSTYELQGEIYALSMMRDITERKRHIDELEAVSMISTALRKARSSREMCPIVIDRLIQVVNGRGGTIGMEDPISGDTIVLYGSGEFAPYTGFRIPAGKGITSVITRSKKPYICHDLSKDPYFLWSSSIERCKEAIVFPMIAQKQVIGGILISREYPFTPTEVKLIGSVAEMAANAIQRNILFEETERNLIKLVTLRQIDQAISSMLDLQKVMNIILVCSQKFLHVDAADILFYKEETQQLKYAYGIGFHTDKIKALDIHLGEGWAGRAVQTGKAAYIPSLEKTRDEVYDKLSRAEKFISYYGVPLVVSRKIKGVMECYTRTPLKPDKDWEGFMNLLAGQAAIAINSAQLFNDIKQSNIQIIQAYDETIEGWSRAMDMRDRETEGHNQRVVELTLRLAKLVGVPESELIHIRRGTLLHDIGKLVVPDSILFKPSTLTEEEWTIMKKHPLHAQKMLASVAYLKPALDIPFCHHEYWDGNGYPRGLSGTDIPLAARIFAVVDVWDALRSDRPYRPAWSREKTIAYIKRQAGRKLDPNIVPLFVKLVSESQY